MTLPKDVIVIDVSLPIDPQAAARGARFGDAWWAALGRWLDAGGTGDSWGDLTWEERAARVNVVLDSWGL